MSLSIKRKLILFFIITSVIPMIILGGFTYVETYNAVGTSEQKRMEEQVGYIADSINIALEDTEDMTKSLSSTPSLITLLSKYSQVGTTDKSTVDDVNRSLRKIYVDAGGIYENMLVVGRNGKVLVDSWNGKYVGQSVATEKYFQQALRDKTFVIGEVANSNLSVTKVKLPVISMALPVLARDNSVLGAIVITYDLNYFTRHLYKDSLGEKRFGYMFDQTGRVLYHPNIDLLMKPVTLPAARQILVNMNSDMSKYHKGKGETQIDGDTYLYYYHTVPKSKWIVSTFIPHNQLYQVADWLRGTTVIILLLVGLISLMAVTYMVKTIGRALGEMKSLLNKVELRDYSSRCTIKSGDEFEDLGNAFNQMLDEQSSYISKLVQAAEKAESVSGKVTRLVGKIKSDVDAISAVTQEVSAGAETNDHSIREMKSSMEQLVAEIKKIRVSSGKAVELGSNTVKSAANGGEMVADTMQSIDDIAKSTAESALSVKELYLAMDSINSFTNIIKALSAETNMIAINAAIQAANAGEFGLTFGVVASKIKDLAQASDDAAKKISLIIAEIRNREQTLMRDMDSVEEYVKTGLQKAERTVYSFDNITRDVSRNEGIIGDILGSIEEQLVSMEEAAKNMDKISQTTAKTSEGTAFIADNIKHEAKVLGQINDTSRELKNSAQDLFEMVSTIRL